MWGAELALYHKGSFLAAKLARHHEQQGNAIQYLGMKTRPHFTFENLLNIELQKCISEANYECLGDGLLVRFAQHELVHNQVTVPSGAVGDDHRHVSNGTVCVSVC